MCCGEVHRCNCSAPEQRIKLSEKYFCSGSVYQTSVHQTMSSYYRKKSKKIISSPAWPSPGRHHLISKDMVPPGFMQQLIALRGVLNQLVHLYSLNKVVWV